MNFIALAIIGFVFVCIAMPQLVKHRSQFFIAVWGAVIIILLSAIEQMADPGGGFHKVVAGLGGIFDLLTFIVLIMATGGLSLRELGSELGSAYEVMRRGDTEKTVIIPLTGEHPKRRDAAPPEDPSSAAAPRVELTDPTATPVPRKASSRDSGRIPME